MKKVELYSVHRDFTAEFKEAVNSSNVNKNPRFEVGSMLIVGGILTKDDDFIDGMSKEQGGEQLSMVDSDRVVELVKKMTLEGVRFSPDTQVYISNMLYGHDFIRNPQSADVVMMSMVNKGEKAGRRYPESELAKVDGAWE